MIVRHNFVNILILRCYYAYSKNTYYAFFSVMKKGFQQQQRRRRRRR